MAGGQAPCHRRRSLCTAVACPCADGARVRPGCSASPTSRSSETCEPRTMEVITAAPHSLASTSTPRAPAASGRIVTRNGAAWSTRSAVCLCAATLPRTAIGGVQHAACAAAASKRRAVRRAEAAIDNLAALPKTALAKRAEEGRTRAVSAVTRRTRRRRLASPSPSARPRGVANELKL